MEVKTSTWMIRTGFKSQICHRELRRGQTHFKGKQNCTWVDQPFQLDWLLELWSGHPQGFSLYPHVLCNLATSFGDKHHLQASVSLKAAAPYNNWTFRKEIQQYSLQASFRFSAFKSFFFLFLPSPLAILFLIHLQTGFLHVFKET